MIEKFFVSINQIEFNADVNINNNTIKCPNNIVIIMFTESYFQPRLLN